VTEEIQTFRDHFLSVYQSAVTEVARRIDAQPPKTGRRSRSALHRSASSLFPGFAAEIARREYAQSRGQVIPSSKPVPPKRVLSASDAARACTDLAFRYMKARLTGDSKAPATIQAEFEASICDPIWATTIKEYLQYFGSDGSRRHIPYIRASGTGAQPAVQVLRQIAEWNPDVLIHLGDIYYSGTPRECASNFTSLIETVLRRKNPELTVYTLAGNHDMYCGGVGYYDLIRTLNPEPFNQPASFFCLRSADEKWQLLAMDTGLHDYNPLGVDDAVTFIEDDELEWHCARLKEFPGSTMILSHHQLFSAFSPIGKADEKGCRSASNPHLLRAFNSMTACRRICAWFWGHEHTLCIYEPFAGLQRGRCLGHGAVPVSILDKIYVPLPGLDKAPTIIEKTQLRQQGSVYAHGYASLRFGADVCSAEYYQIVNGRCALIYSETIM
jgi:3',5'-cyclic AMP phosphodiesterase CpdA